MSIKVLIKRKFPKEKETEKELLKCIREIRSLVPHQQGFISSEYLKPIDDRNEITTVSNWFSFEDWRIWLESEARKQIQSKIDNIQGVTSEYTVYRNMKTR
jgi:heme-degrading monooxygenase HmoA